jgi:hypothetical protein
MKRTTRLVAGTLATVALAAGMTTATATTANAALINAISDLNWTATAPTGPPSAYPGMFIDTTGDMGADANGVKYTYKVCTMSVVGTDSAGRRIGITAGHCVLPASNKTGEIVDIDPSDATKLRAVKHGGPARGVTHTNNDYPVFDQNDVKFADQEVAAQRPKPQVNPIGWVRWVDPDVCDWDPTKAPANQELDGFLQPCPEDPEARETDLDSTTDYMVIEFAPEVQLSSQVLDKARNPVMSTVGGGKPFKVNSIHTDSVGIPALPRVFPYNDQIENFGAVSNRQTISTTPSSGPTLLAYSNGVFRANATFKAGDSGGPAVMRGTGEWVGIISKMEGELLGVLAPYWYTSAKNILYNLAARGGLGSGFTPTNN